MCQNEKIEILMATYNGEKYIKEQINSIINQTYPNWRLLIRDDGSKDKTVEIIKEYEKKDDRIKLLEDNKGNLGFVKNFEELTKNSKEKYVMFSDQDDYWLENKLEIYINELNKLLKEEIEGPLLLHSNSFVCDDNLEIIKEKFIVSKEALRYKENNYFFSYTVQGSTVLLNRKLIDIGLPFLESVTLHDRYFHLLAEFFGKRVFIDKSLIKYRQHLNNKIGAKSSIIKKILRKRYFEGEKRNLILEIREKYRNKVKFEEEERNLMLEIREKYRDKMKKELGEWIDKYLEVTDSKRNIIERFIKSFKFRINLKKRVSILLKE
jgi:glycosyltransferase, family 2